MTDVSLAATGVAEAHHDEAPASPCEPDHDPRRRRWPASEKVRIASESFVPGVSVNDVATRHSVTASTLSQWRRQAVRGASLAPCRGFRQFPPRCPLSSARAPTHRRARRSPFPMPAAILRFQKPHQITVAHRRQRVILHRAFGEGQPADEQVSHEYSAPVFRKGRTIDRLIGAEIFHQGLRHRVNVAFWLGIKGGTVFPEEPLRPCCPEPL